MNETPTASKLIERAFEIARESGKADWWAMRSPVLKNRLLMLTNTTFKEADFDAVSFRDFLNKASNVSVDATSLPPMVILKAAAPTNLYPPRRNPPGGLYVRKDLWNAILDYSSGHRYVWDIDEKVARQAGPDDRDYFLPTVSAKDLNQWRSDFVELHRPQDADRARRVDEWCQKELPTAALPTALQPHWNKHLKQQVEDRLQQWFEVKLVDAPVIVEKGQEASQPIEAVESLRKFVVDCVKVMSKRELLELRIAPATAMRTLQGER